MSRLLILTQTIDPADPQLGFFHDWVAALAERTAHTHVICLKKGSYNLPHNVAVHSLGKEIAIGASMFRRLRYMLRFWRYAWKFRNEYDVVFVHMNQEYVLLGAPLWRFLGKQIYLWRNHYVGNFLTTLACILSDRVFYTSRHSYTARYKHAMRMPVGVECQSVREGTQGKRQQNSLLFLARLDPSKRVEVFLDALGILANQGKVFTATIVGGPSDPSSSYPEQLRKRAEILHILDRTTFVGQVAAKETTYYYQTHEIFVNCARSGMFDKTIFEAAAAGCLVLASSDDFREEAGEQFYFPDGDHGALARQIARLLERRDEWKTLRSILAATVEAHTLAILVDRLATAMNLSRSTDNAITNRV